jgi:DNA polymerase V
MHRLTGFPSPAEEYAQPPLSLDSLLIRRPLATFPVRFTGDAMTGVGINDGDLLAVERVLYFPPGSIVLAFYQGQRIIRQFTQHAGRFYLSAPGQREIEINESVELFGVVLCSITCFPKTKTQAHVAV